MADEISTHMPEEGEFLRFGFAQEDSLGKMLDLPGACEYLRQCGMDHGMLTQARHRQGQSSEFSSYHIPTGRRCDFCGRYLTGVEYDILKDGRERCAECTATTVTGRQENILLFEKTKADMLQRFAIDIDVPITVKVIGADEIARERGKSFRPTTNMDIRSVGSTVKKRGKFSMLIENETPRISLVSTMVHELTHVWQHTHWDMRAIKRKYGRTAHAVIEGLAVWAEAQYLFLINESRRATYYLDESVERKDDYGRGIRLYLAQYSISRGIALEGQSPFENVKTPIAKDILNRG